MVVTVVALTLKTQLSTNSIFENKTISPSKPVPARQHPVSHVVVVDEGFALKTYLTDWS